MNRTFLGALCALATLFGATPLCDAALFASTPDQLLQIDSSTGEIVKTYPFPEFVDVIPVSSGLAFDGRYLYFNGIGPTSGAGGPLFRFDLATEFWHPFVPIITPPVSTSIPRLIGLGYASSLPGGGLVGVTASASAVPQSSLHLFSPVHPFGIEPVVALSSFPLPMDFIATGADVDPSTGEIWIIGDKVAGATRTPHLIRTDITGAVLTELTPQVPSPTTLRGLGFDGGKMFVVGRTLPQPGGQIYEIDRSSGAVLKTLSVPTLGLASGLTGGNIIPEPGACGSCCVLLLALAASRHRQRAPLA